MPTLNEETGYYQGKTFEHDGQTYIGECVPTAVANYLKIHKVPQQTFRAILNDLVEQPEYKGVDKGFSTYHQVPEVIERVLRQHLNDNIEVILYAISPQEVIPEQHRTHLKHIDARTEIPNPFLALTDFGAYQHLWVAAGNPLERIDSDGKVHELRPFRGYLEIKGLKF